MSKPKYRHLIVPWLGTTDCTASEFVRRFKAHDQLVEALRALLESVQSVQELAERGVVSQPTSEVIVQVENALKLADEN